VRGEGGEGMFWGTKYDMLNVRERSKYERDQSIKNYQLDCHLYLGMQEGGVMYTLLLRIVSESNLTAKMLKCMATKKRA
jgi:hypothetical protein